MLPGGAASDGGEERGSFENPLPLVAELRAIAVAVRDVQDENLMRVVPLGAKNVAEVDGFRVFLCGGHLWAQMYVYWAHKSRLWPWKPELFGWRPPENHCSTRARGFESRRDGVARKSKIILYDICTITLKSSS